MEVEYPDAQEDDFNLSAFPDGNSLDQLPPLDSSILRTASNRYPIRKAPASSTPKRNVSPATRENLGGENAYKNEEQQLWDVKKNLSTEFEKSFSKRGESYYMDQSIIQPGEMEEMLAANSGIFENFDLDEDDMGGLSGSLISPYPKNRDQDSRLLSTTQRPTLNGRTATHELGERDKTRFPFKANRLQSQRTSINSSNLATSLGSKGSLSSRYGQEGAGAGVFSNKIREGSSTKATSQNTGISNKFSGIGAKFTPNRSYKSSISTTGQIPNEGSFIPTSPSFKSKMDEKLGNVSPTSTRTTPLWQTELDRKNTKNMSTPAHGTETKTYRDTATKPGYGRTTGEGKDSLSLLSGSGFTGFGFPSKTTHPTPTTKKPISYTIPADKEPPLPTPVPQPRPRLSSSTYTSSSSRPRPSLRPTPKGPSHRFSNSYLSNNKYTNTPKKREEKPSSLEFSPIQMDKFKASDLSVGGNDGNGHLTSPSRRNFSQLKSYWTQSLRSNTNSSVPTRHRSITKSIGSSGETNNSELISSIDTPRPMPRKSVSPMEQVFSRYSDPTNTTQQSATATGSGPSRTPLLSARGPKRLASTLSSTLLPRKTTPSPSLPGPTEDIYSSEFDRRLRDPLRAPGVSNTTRSSYPLSSSSQFQSGKTEQKTTSTFMSDNWNNAKRGVGKPESRMSMTANKYLPRTSTTTTTSSKHQLGKLDLLSLNQTQPRVGLTKGQDSFVTPPPRMDISGSTGSTYNPLVNRPISHTSNTGSSNPEIKTNPIPPKCNGGFMSWLSRSTSSNVVPTITTSTTGLGTDNQNPDTNISGNPSTTSTTALSNQGNINQPQSSGTTPTDHLPLPSPPTLATDSTKTQKTSPSPKPSYFSSWTRAFGFGMAADKPPTPDPEPIPTPTISSDTVGTVGMSKPIGTRPLEPNPEGDVQPSVPVNKSAGGYNFMNAFSTFKEAQLKDEKARGSNTNTNQNTTNTNGPVKDNVDTRFTNSHSLRYSLSGKSSRLEAMRLGRDYGVGTMDKPINSDFLTYLGSSTTNASAPLPKARPGTVAGLAGENSKLPLNKE
eukprot:Ihof_evm8s72 gene=Ihof_evmTU8s72